MWSKTSPSAQLVTEKFRRPCWPAEIFPRSKRIEEQNATLPGCPSGRERDRCGLNGARRARRWEECERQSKRPRVGTSSNPGSHEAASPVQDCRLRRTGTIPCPGQGPAPPTPCFLWPCALTGLRSTWKQLAVAVIQSQQSQINRLAGREVRVVPQVVV